MSADSEPIHHIIPEREEDEDGEVLYYARCPECNYHNTLWDTEDGTHIVCRHAVLLSFNHFAFRREADVFNPDVQEPWVYFGPDPAWSGD